MSTSAANSNPALSAAASSTASNSQGPALTGKPASPTEKQAVAGLVSGDKAPSPKASSSETPKMGDTAPQQTFQAKGKTVTANVFGQKRAVQLSVGSTAMRDEPAKPELGNAPSEPRQAANPAPQAQSDSALGQGAAETLKPVSFSAGTDELKGNTASLDASATLQGESQPLGNPKLEEFGDASRPALTRTTSEQLLDGAKTKPELKRSVSFGDQPASTPNDVLKDAEAAREAIANGEKNNASTTIRKAVGNAAWKRAAKKAAVLGHFKKDLAQIQARVPNGKALRKLEKKLDQLLTKRDWNPLQNNSITSTSNRLEAGYAKAMKPGKTPSSSVKALKKLVRSFDEFEKTLETKYNKLENLHTEMSLLAKGIDSEVSKMMDENKQVAKENEENRNTPGFQKKALPHSQEKVGELKKRSDVARGLCKADGTGKLTNALLDIKAEISKVRELKTTAITGQVERTVTAATRDYNKAVTKFEKKTNRAISTSTVIKQKNLLEKALNQAKQEIGKAQTTLSQIPEDNQTSQAKRTAMSEAKQALSKMLTQQSEQLESHFSGLCKDMGTSFAYNKFTREKAGLMRNAGWAGQQSNHLSAIQTASTHASQAEKSKAQRSDAIEALEQVETFKKRSPLEVEIEHLKSQRALLDPSLPVEERTKQIEARLDRAEKMLSAPKYTRLARIKIKAAGVGASISSWFTKTTEGATKKQDAFMSDASKKLDRLRDAGLLNDSIKDDIIGKLERGETIGPAKPVGPTKAVTSSEDTQVRQARKDAFKADRDAANEARDAAFKEKLATPIVDRSSGLAPEDGQLVVAGPVRDTLDEPTGLIDQLKAEKQLGDASIQRELAPGIAVLSAIMQGQADG